MYEKQIVQNYLTVKELSLFLNIKEKTIYAMVAAKDIPHVRYGKSIRFCKARIDQWIEEKTVEVESKSQQIGELLNEMNRPHQMEINEIFADAIEEVRKKEYNSCNGKPASEKVKKGGFDGTLSKRLGLVDSKNC